MAAVPVSLPVINLLQQTLLPQSLQVHVAEVFMSGLLQVCEPPGAGRRGAGEPSAGDRVLCYEFVPGVREALLAGMPTDQTEAVLDTVSAYLSERLGLSTRSFSALMARLPELVQRSTGDDIEQRMLLPFARIAVQTLERMGGYYAEVAQQVVRPAMATARTAQEFARFGFPPLQTKTFDVPIVVPAAQEVEPEPEVRLQSFKFRTATLVQRRAGFLRREMKWEIQASESAAQRFIEVLPGPVELAMVLIPGGQYQMGSPSDEKERFNREGPQHPVTVPQFFLGQYAVTQAQYETVMGSNPATRYDKARFVGPNISYSPARSAKKFFFKDRVFHRQFVGAGCAQIYPENGKSV